jgi:hypothetical protein
LEDLLAGPVQKTDTADEHSISAQWGPNEGESGSKRKLGNP